MSSPKRTTVTGTCVMCEMAFIRVIPEFVLARAGGIVRYCSRACSNAARYHDPDREPTLPPDDPNELGVLCACGSKLHNQSDPLTGVAFDWCRKCGKRPIPVRGQRTYDQRERLERRIAEELAVATNPEPQNEGPRHGEHRLKEIRTGKRSAA